jgi:hypothetical protein
MSVDGGCKGGISREGQAVGCNEGKVESVSFFEMDGCTDGKLDPVGMRVKGLSDGIKDGAPVEMIDGVTEGSLDETLEGDTERSWDESLDGEEEGFLVVGAVVDGEAEGLRDRSTGAIVVGKCCRIISLPKAFPIRTIVSARP